MGPAFGKSAKDIPLDTQFLLVEVQEGGPYALVLPLLDGDFRASLVGSRKNEIVCHQESGDEKVKTSGTRAVYIGVGDDPYELIRHSFAAVANETKTFSTIDKKTIPSHVDEFGWCTWDAFYSEVAPHGVIEGVKSLRGAKKEGHRNGSCQGGSFQRREQASDNFQGCQWNTEYIRKGCVYTI